MWNRLWAFGSPAVFCLVAVASPAPVRAQEERVEIIRQLKASVSRPLREMPPEPIEGGHLHEIPVRPLPGRPETVQVDAALQTTTTSSVNVATTLASILMEWEWDLSGRMGAHP